MATPKPWPRWIETDDNTDSDEDSVLLREVAPNLFVGAEMAPLYPPGQKKWELVVDWYGSSGRWPSRTKGTAKAVLSIPFLDGDVFPPGALDRVLRRVRTAKKRGPVLIHCFAGLSRSASATYALLRRLSRLPHREALRRVKVTPEYPMPATLASARAWAEGPGRDNS